MPGVVAQFATRREALRPMYDQGCGNAAFMHPGFMQAERGVRRARPTGPDAQESFRRTWRGRLIVPFAANDLLGAGTVIRHEEDQRVFERVQDARPRRPAAGGVVELGKAQAARGQLVEIRRPDLPAVAARIGEAHVIRHDHQNVRLRRGGGDAGQ